ncbi:MAG TPA: hypothetical protein VLC71_05025 [Thermomonas sp.]|nr:hypothetical protein [Thermomonas sp.]
MKKILVAACVACALSAPALAQTMADAQKLFEQYQDMQRNFDPAVAGLYCDTAVIRKTGTSSTGERRTKSLPAPKYKEFIESAMFLAEETGDYIAYSNVRFAQEPGGIRINADRYSVLKTNSSSVSLLVGSCNGQPAIIEELSQSHR